MRFAIHTVDNLDSLAGLVGMALRVLVGMALRVLAGSLGRGRGGHLAVAHRVGKGPSDPGQGKVEDFRSSFGMQNLSCSAAASARTCHGH